MTTEGETPRNSEFLGNTTTEPTDISFIIVNLLKDRGLNIDISEPRGLGRDNAREIERGLVGLYADIQTADIYKRVGRTPEVLSFNSASFISFYGKRGGRLMTLDQTSWDKKTKSRVEAYSRQQNSLAAQRISTSLRDVASSNSGSTKSTLSDWASQAETQGSQDLSRTRILLKNFFRKDLEPLTAEEIQSLLKPAVDKVIAGYNPPLW